jgi:single-strand DNA-binding protein
MTHVHKNEVNLAGTVSRVPELRYTKDGTAVATFTLATKYKQSTELHRVVCWDRLAEKIQPVRANEFVEISGNLRTRSWDDKETGKKKYMTEVNAWQVVLPERETPVTNAHGVKASDGDIPF